MNAKSIIRDTVAAVTELRRQAQAQPGLSQAVSDIKRFQARRFSATYADLLQSTQFKQAAAFFLNELYCDKDFTERDTQFARIAGALERIFPPQVVDTAVALAQLHGLTEDLDLAMAKHWANTPQLDDTLRYIDAWRMVGRRADRDVQLHTTLEVGTQLDRLTRKPGLRMMLRMMRRPATLAGLGALQQFLETGFDTFADMGRQDNGCAYFLTLVKVRENHAFIQLFNTPRDLCRAEFAALFQENASNG